MKKNKILIILIAAVVFLLVFAVIGKKAGWFGKAATVKVAVENAERRRITEAITANGKIQPEKEVKITPDVSGEIVELTVSSTISPETSGVILTSFSGCIFPLAVIASVILLLSAFSTATFTVAALPNQPAFLPMTAKISRNTTAAMRMINILFFFMIVSFSVFLLIQ